MGGVPFTFLAHQAPVLPIKRRWPRLDGVALVVGSAVPDLAAATQNLPIDYIAGRPTWYDGHSWSQQLAWCLPVGLLLTWWIRRLIAPRIVPYLPDLGPFHLRDYALVGRNRHRWWTIASCVLIGSVSHVVVDGLTHSDKGVISIPSLDTGLFVVGGRTVTTGHVLQVVATVGLALWCVWQLRRIGLDREMSRWAGLDPGAPDAVVPVPPALNAVRGVIVVIVLASVLAIPSQVHRGSTTAIMSAVWFVLVGLTVVSVGCWIGAGRTGRQPVPVP